MLAVVTLGILCYFAMQGLQYLSDPLTTTLTYEYSTEEGIDLSGYVVRNERLLPDESSGLLQLRRSEGEKVSSGGLVATVYADQASLDRQNELSALAAQLEQLEYAQEAALGAEVTLKLDSQITQSLLDFRADVAAGRLDKAEEHESDLRTLVLKRDYTSSDTETLDSQITELQAQLKSLRSQAAASSRNITAPVSGIYSAVVDGFETVLTPESLEGITPSQLAACQANSTAQSSVGKLILGDTWYYAAAMSTEDAKALAAESAELEKGGGSLTLCFSKSVEQDMSVLVDAVGPDENGRSVVVFRSRSYLPQVTLLRQQSAQLIRKSVSGLRIPKEALRASNTRVSQDGTRTVEEGLGVYCIVGMEARFKPVEVLYNGDSFVLVRSTVNTDQEKLRLRPGDEVIISAADLYDGKIIE